MQEYMTTYNTNSEDIEQFINQTINNLGSLKIKEAESFSKLFDVFPSLELIYTCDKDSLKQTSNNIYREKTTNTQVGINRSYLMKKLDFKDDFIAISKPYISSDNGITCITAARIENDTIYFLDFNLKKLLQRLGLIEIQKEFNIVNKGFYFLASVVMMILALFTVCYSLSEIYGALTHKADMGIEAIFKPIIAITLGLAIFDLGKTIIEQEVIFKSYLKSSKTEYKVLTKFSITILIALMIESLMVVFKIAIEDYSQMINAVYLIFGVGFLMAMLGVFIYLSKKS